MKAAIGALVIAQVLVVPSGLLAKEPKKDNWSPLPLDEYVAQANARASSQRASSPGAILLNGSILGDLARDPVASQVDDIITVVVVERASGVATGTVKSNRSSQARSSITAAAGVMNPGGAVANLARLGSQVELEGEGNTSRSTVLTTTMTGRVTHVLPNGFLVIEAVKSVQINSEQQLVSVRGIVRPIDLSPFNAIRSDQIGQLELRLNGKGVVGDAVRRPFILYRILLGLLPF
jgi:flagellar L-ring protein precursor FlgH